MLGLAYPVLVLIVQQFLMEQQPLLTHQTAVALGSHQRCRQVRLGLASREIKG
jgi:hypothetical protein